MISGLFGRPTAGRNMSKEIVLIALLINIFVSSRERIFNFFLDIFDDSLRESRKEIKVALKSMNTTSEDFKEQFALHFLTSFPCKPYIRFGKSEVTRQLWYYE